MVFKYYLYNYTPMVEFHSPDSEPFGLSYEEHIVKDWKRNLTAPIDRNPMEDKTGQWSSYGVDPNSQVLYLSGNTGGTTQRTCKAPKGSGVFISICDAVYSEAEKPGSTIEDLDKLATKDQDSAYNVYLKINDEEFKLEDLKKYRFHTGPFDVVIPPEETLFGLRAGPTKAVADGYYVITEPLSAGNYTIVTKANISEPTWNSEVKYNLVVE
jgi:hypothetical protein